MSSRRALRDVNHLGASTDEASTRSVLCIASGSGLLGEDEEHLAANVATV